MRDSPDRDLPLPDLREGDLVEAEITGLAHGGAGVSRVGGFVVFVRGGLPGDRVRARVTGRKRSFAQAEIAELLTPSSQRVRPPCPHFGACGGCQWMDLAYDAQLAAKQSQVADCLSRIGRLGSVQVHPIVPSPRSLRYRNKMEFAFDAGAGGLHAGLHRADDPSVIEPIEGCHLQDPVADRILGWTVGACREVCGEPGLLRRLVIRRGSDGRFLVVFEVRGSRFPEGTAIARRMREAFPEVGGVVHMSVDAEGFPGPSEVLAGENLLREDSEGLAMTVSAGAFLQVNPEQAYALYRRVEEWAAPESGDDVLDLFCGAGAITLRLARRARRATGVESSPEAVRCAEANARANGISNCRFVSADAGARRRRCCARGARSTSSCSILRARVCRRTSRARPPGSLRVARSTCPATRPPWRGTWRG